MSWYRNLLGVVAWIVILAPILPVSPMANLAGPPPSSLSSLSTLLLARPSTSYYPPTARRPAYDARDEAAHSLESGWRSYPAGSLAWAVEMDHSRPGYDHSSLDYANWQDGRSADVDLDYDQPCAASSCPSIFAVGRDARNWIASAGARLLLAIEEMVDYADRGQQQVISFCFDLFAGLLVLLFNATIRISVMVLACKALSTTKVIVKESPRPRFLITVSSIERNKYLALVLQPKVTQKPVERGNPSEGKPLAGEDRGRVVERKGSRWAANPGVPAEGMAADRKGTVPNAAARIQTSAVQLQHTGRYLTETMPTPPAIPNLTPLLVVFKFEQMGFHDISGKCEGNVRRAYFRWRRSWIAAPHMREKGLKIRMCTKQGAEFKGSILL
ncbi:hypothetical protein BDV93DRAFT_510703 [Ceratobasidium sp. AG-I]|nr:hypothetical protein BDV93DRAFT_510703 [Ceratobasidium sp. AG-I]